MHIARYRAFCHSDSDWLGYSAKGNPAAVVTVSEWPSDRVMMSIHHSNHLPVTTFISSQYNEHGEQHFVRWFSATGEIGLCGHGSVCGAHHLIKQGAATPIVLNSDYGIVRVDQAGEQLKMELPVWERRKVALDDPLVTLLSDNAVDAFKTRHLVIVLPDLDSVATYQPDFVQLRRLTTVLGLIITAKASDSRYVLRYFSPTSGFNEDIATGTAQGSIADYWFNQLDSDELDAVQLSERGGYFQVKRKSSDCLELLVEVADYHEPMK